MRIPVSYAAAAVFILGLGAGDGVQAAVEAPRSAEVQIRTAIADMNRAAVALDADRFMAWYWNSPALAITFDGETMRGWRPILDQQRLWWSDKTAAISFVEKRPPEITVQGGDVATTIQWMSVKSAKDAKPADLTITSVWKKRPEGWRIVLAHESLVD